MTDALTDTEADDGSPSGLAPSAPPGSEAQAPGSEAVVDDDAPRLEQGELEVEGSFGQRLKRWFVRLGNRILAAPAESFITFVIVVFCIGFVMISLGMNQVFANNTPAGGDMGAHVWGPAFMRDHLLTKGRLTGWTPDWYAGFPAYQFYMVLPSLAIALLSLVIPYGVAFKLVAVSGVLTLPIAAWACAKLSDLPFPAPPLFAIAGTVYLYDRSFSIYGGNIPSTLAGEFAFSISLSFAVLFLGVFARALRTGTGKHRGWAAVLLALCGLCHLIPFIFAIIGSVLMVLLMPGLTAKAKERIGGLIGLGVAGGLYYLANPNKGYTAPWAILNSVVAPSEGMQAFLHVLAIVVGIASVLVLGFTIVTAGRHLLYTWFPVLAVGGLLSAWWTVPFYLNHKYMNDMGWEKKDDVLNMLFQRTKLDPQLVDGPPIKWLLILAGAGALLSLIWWRRGGVFWLLTAATFAVLFVDMPEGRLWNARLLPFYYLALYFLAAVGIAEVSRLIATLFARDVNRPIRTVMGVTAVAGLSALIVVALPLHSLPGGQTNPEDGSYRWLWFKTNDTSFVSSWANWNFTGYEGKPAYPEYHDIVQTMGNVGKTHGCGRAMWEHEEQHDRYGTPMALMLMPFWTDGCIGSMEGLYFEASSTTPYHFINQDELSRNPSNAQRDLPYTAGPPTKEDFDLGIEHLKMLGVKYYMAISEGPGGMIDLARQNKSLTQVAESGPWQVFMINNGNELVEPLKYEPAVVKLNDPKQPLSQDLQSVPSADGTTKVKTGSPWQFMAMDWYQDPKAWDVHLTDNGPDSWQHINRGDQPKLQAEKPVTVSNISTDEDKMSFDVSETGVPVLVKMSYFPNWKASGADGPWRVAPNLMVVVPTSNHVELHYGYTGVDYLSWVLTILGLVGVVWLFRSKPLAVPDPSDPNALLYTEPAPVEVRWVFDPTTGTFVPSTGPPPPDWGAAPPVGPPTVPADSPVADEPAGGGGVGTLSRPVAPAPPEANPSVFDVEPDPSTDHALFAPPPDGRADAADSARATDERAPTVPAGTVPMVSLDRPPSTEAEPTTDAPSAVVVSPTVEKPPTVEPSPTVETSPTVEPPPTVGEATPDGEPDETERGPEDG